MHLTPPSPLRPPPPLFVQYEKLMACPSLRLKYVEVSCYTNENMHVLERITLRALHTLPSPSTIKMAHPSIRQVGAL